MISVAPQPEPVDFDERVRQPGLSALAELVGEEPLRQRPGPRREPVAQRREDLRGTDFPEFWTRALPSLYELYGGYCAYLAVRIDEVTGARNVDHFVARTVDWRLAYEWSNYRLSAQRMNGRKGVHGDVIDPFLLQPGTFRLEVVTGRIYATPDLSEPDRENACRTIKRLGLDDYDCRKMRQLHYQYYCQYDWSEDFFQQHSPFVWAEAARQGLLRREPILRQAQAAETQVDGDRGR